MFIIINGQSRERLRRYYQRQNEHVQMNEELERIRQQQPPNQPLPLEFIMGMRPSIDFNNNNPNSNLNRHRHRNYDPRNDNRRYLPPFFILLCRNSRAKMTTNFKKKLILPKSGLSIRLTIRNRESTLNLSSKDHTEFTLVG
ncbi:hypothetical protein DERP_006287, partial [Dermatophagoides pteronyssinus]